MTRATMQDRVKELVEKREKEIGWMLAEAMACKPMELWSLVKRTTYRDNEQQMDTCLWTYMSVPFMRCVTWLTLEENKFQFKLGRIDSGEKIIALSTERNTHREPLN